MVVFEEMEIDQVFGMKQIEEKKDEAVQNMFRKV